MNKTLIYLLVLSTLLLFPLSLLAERDEDIHYRKAEHPEKSTLHKVKDALLGESPKERAKEAMEHQAEYLRVKADSLEGNAKIAMEMKAENIQNKADSLDGTLKEKGTLTRTYIITVYIIG